MRLHFLIALLMPPFAVALTGRWLHLLLNVPLTLLLWLPGALHAVVIVYGSYACARSSRLCELGGLDDAGG